MKEEMKKVKYKGEEVAEIAIPVYESLEDALAYKEEADLVSLINRQNAADLMNAERGKHREAPAGKAKMYAMAYNKLPEIVFADGQSGRDKLIATLTLPEAQRKKALDELINSPEVQEAIGAAEAA